MSEETGKGPARVENHGKGMFYVDVGGKVLSEYFDTFGAAELVCMEINAVIEPLSRKAALCERMDRELKDTPGCGRPVSEALRLAAGILMGSGGGPVQQDLEMIADAFDEWSTEFDREATK